MLAKFTPTARRIVVRSGLLAIDAGRAVVGTDLLLLALAEADRGGAGLAGGLAAHGVTADAVRGEIRRRRSGPAGRPDRELLALLGIDLDEVRRRVAEATSTDAGDPALWHLRRSRVRPLRLTLAGPAGSLLLDGPSRKVVEVAVWARRRGGRDLATAEDLLWGLLADSANESVRVLCRLGVDLHRLWSDLRRWYTAACVARRPDARTGYPAPTFSARSRRARPRAGGATPASRRLGARGGGVNRDAWIREVRRDAARRFDTLHAPTYDRDWGDIGRTHLAFVDRLVGGCRPAGRVLDAACGTGKYFPTILESGRRVVGTDQSAGMLEVARAKHPEVPTWRVGLQELAFDGEFDAVMCVDAMENVFPEDWPLVLGNLRRAMRPDARLYLTVELPDEDALRESSARAAERGLPVVDGEQVGEGGGYHFYPSRERVAGWLDGARLAVVEEAEGDDYWHLLLAWSPAEQQAGTSEREERR